MPTSAPFRALLAAVLLCGAAGCSEVAGDEDVASAEGELGASEAGVVPGSLEAEGVVLLANDRALDATALERRAGVSSSLAWAIESFRTMPDGSARWFSSVDEIDELPQSNVAGFRKLLAAARTHGYVEAPGFDPPTAARLSVPDNLGRPPTSRDVTVEAGFDGKTVAEVKTIVRARITNEVHERNERFVADTIAETHKAFTIAVGNLFAQGSPHATFAANLQADKLTMLGTMSSDRPTVLMAEKAGTKTFYARGASGGYEPTTAPQYVVMRARVRLASAGEGQGVRVFYPAWSAKQLARTTEIIETGNGD